MRRVTVVAVTLLSLLCAGAPADASQSYPTKDAKRIEYTLAKLGLPVGKIDGIWDKDTGRATCAWRELTGRPVLRSWPTSVERRALKSTTALRLPKGLWVGLNINLQCQTALWVGKGLVTHTRVETHTVTTETTTVAGDTSTVGVETGTSGTDTATAGGETTTVTTVETVTVTFTKLEQVIKRVFPVSSGQSAFPTVPGKHVVTWTVNRWWQSTIYADGKMYRPMFFHGGQALHGSSSDSLVMWYPASHGCVRMLHADIDALWDAGFGHGSVVSLYGTWKG